MKATLVIGLFTFISPFLLCRGLPDEPKNNDKDVIYDETKIPPYDLPSSLVSSEGKPVLTAEEWFNRRN